MDPKAKKNVRARSLTAVMKLHQEENVPVHTWSLAKIPSESEWIDNYKTIEQFMTTDLFTVGPDDVLKLAANVMHWKHVRHVPVEDKKGRLVGIVSRRDVIELLALGKADLTRETSVEEIMKTDLVVISPETPTLEGALSDARQKHRLSTGRTARKASWPRYGIRFSDRIGEAA